MLQWVNGILLVLILIILTSAAIIQLYDIIPKKPREMFAVGDDVVGEMY